MVEEEDATEGGISSKSGSMGEKKKIWIVSASKAARTMPENAEI